MHCTLHPGISLSCLLEDYEKQKEKNENNQDGMINFVDKSG